MPFQRQPLPRVEITDTTIEGVGRVYHTPDGDFDSVTTIIGRKSDGSWLEEWKKRVGVDVAAGISQQARTRGSAIHLMAENYVNGHEWRKGQMPVNVASFLKIKKVLDENVDVIYGVEFPLWSKILNTAGRTDLPCRFGGVNTVLDHKTSRGIKSREDIEGYFIQTSCYSLMLEERTGVKFPQVAVVITTDGLDDAQVFLEPSKRWYDRVREVFCT